MLEKYRSKMNRTFPFEDSDIYLWNNLGKNFRKEFRKELYWSLMEYKINLKKDKPHDN